MENNIKLSTMVTFCNQNEFIKDALNSCVNQKTNFNQEILIGLDNGDDESRKIIQEYIKKYPYIKLFEIDNSKLNITGIEKASNNRLNLLKHAQGEYICFLDGDDFYTDENRHQIMVDFLDNNSNYIAAFHDWVKYDNTKKCFLDFPPTSKVACAYTPKSYIRIHKQFSCFTYRNIFKNAKLNDFNFNVVNDSTFTYYFLKYGNFFFISQKMYAYRIGVESIFFNQKEITQTLYSLLCAEINQKYIPQYQKELCKNHRHYLKKIYKKRKLLKEINLNELNKIKNFAKRENCYFTYNLINYSKLNIFEKIKFNTYKNIFIYAKKNPTILTNKIKKLCYFNTRANFGDELNLYILQRLFDINIMNANSDANLIAIGSYLEQVTTNKIKHKNKSLKIWGTGFIEEQKTKKEFFKKQAKVLALRGTYTKERIEKILNKKSNCPLGDPGLLASKLLDKLPNKEYEVGLILHYMDKNSSFIKNIKIENYNFIDITKNPIQVLNEIAKCKVILSSAMHGLIASDSLNIPNQWIKFGDLLYGGDYKFKDYYSVFNYNPKAIDLRKEIITKETIEIIKEKYKQLNFKEKIEKINEELLESGRRI